MCVCDDGKKLKNIQFSMNECKKIKDREGWQFLGTYMRMSEGGRCKRAIKILERLFIDVVKTPFLHYRVPTL